MLNRSINKISPFTSCLVRSLFNRKQKIDILVFDLQWLADILHDSGLVTDDVIKEELGVEEIQFKTIQFGNPSDKPTLEEWELGRLANQINHDNLVNLATKHFDEQLTSAQISNIGSNNAGDAWSASFEILVHWSRKTGNNRKVRAYSHDMQANVTNGFLQFR